MEQDLRNELDRLALGLLQLNARNMALQATVSKALGQNKEQEEAFRNDAYGLYVNVCIKMLEQDKTGNPVIAEELIALQAAKSARRGKEPS